MKKFRRAVGFAAALCLPLLSLTTAPAAQANPEGVQGAPCQPGQGVTVVVDFSLDGSDVDVRCAPGAWPTIGDAFVGAGFALDSTSFVSVIDGVDPYAMYGEGNWGFGPEGHWGLFTSTVDGTAAGAPSDTWIAASIGAGDGPAQIDQAYLFRVFATFTCTFSWDYYDPATGTFDEEYVEDMIDAEIIDDPDELTAAVCMPQLTLSELGVIGSAVLPSEPSAHYGSADAGLAAAWIASQLKANDNVLNDDSGKTDWGLTIDAIFALASAGVGGDQIAATAAALNASGTAYVGAPGDLATNVGAIAKTVLGLEVAGLDPTNFSGGRDLITDLRSTLNASGSFGAGVGSSFNQALAILALARTDGGVPPQATTWLVGQQCGDGASFTYSGPCPASGDVDSTAMVIQALKAAGMAATDPVIVAAEQWLIAQQDATTGAFVSFNTANSNDTGLAAQALAGNDTVAGLAEKYLGSIQITCDWVLDHSPALAVADIGAIAYNEAAFTNVTDNGLAAAVDQTMRATTQAVLGLGGPDFVSLSAVGVKADVPTATCTPKAPPEPEQPPAEPGQPPVEVNGGGATVPGAAAPAGLAVVCLLTAAILLRRPVVANR